jgi:hypothetical protein
MLNEPHINSPQEDQHAHRQARRAAWGWWFFAATALFYLLTEHQAHFFGALPFLLLLACPLMHLFMHGGHGRHDNRHPAKSEEDQR